MPIRNVGTLLENVMLVEVLRLLDEIAPGDDPIDFVNSFAMPPLAPWTFHTVDRSFDAARLGALRQSARPQPIDSYASLLWSCLQRPAESPGTEGPNGALLCALLSHHIGMPLRLWLNDVPSGHYGNALPALADLNAVVQEVLSLPALPTFTIATCDAGYPASLEPGIADGLHAHFAKWGANARGRLGYLDPMRYRIRNPQAGETSSTDHLAWLRLLSNGFSRPAMSVHFTGHRNWVNLRPEVTRMHHDGVTAGFPHSLTGSHKHYHVVVNIRCSTDATALELAHRLQQAVDAAWTHWAAAVGTDTPNKLTLVVQ